jgi:hypothetical protein
VASVRTLSGEVEYVGRIDHLTPYPVGDIFAEPAPDLRFIPLLVRIAEVLQSGFGPIADRNHDTLLAHLEVLLDREMEATLPRVPEAVRPLARIRIRLAPHILLYPQPSLLLQRKNQL